MNVPIDLRDSTKVRFVGYAYGDTNPDGTEMPDGQDVIEIISTGERWDVWAAIEKGIVFDNFHNSLIKNWNYRNLGEN